MPARYILERSQCEVIYEIILSHNKYLPTYEFIKKQLPNIAIKIVPTGFLKSSLFLACAIFKNKLFGETVYIFHEACWPVLDMLIHFISPKGKFTPLASLDGFEKLSSAEEAKYINGRSIHFLTKYFARKYFHIYKHSLDDNKGYGYDWVFKKYPKPVEYSTFSNTKLPSDNEAAKGISNVKFKEKTIIFLVGSEPVDNQYLSQIYKCYISLALQYGYAVSIKDHPNSDARLNLDSAGCHIYRPEVAAELIIEGYGIAVGVASTSLCNFSGKAISILNSIEKMPQEFREKRLSYIKAMSKSIVFVSNATEFLDQLN